MELFLPIAHMDVNIVLILFYGAIVWLSLRSGRGGRRFLITPLLILPASSIVAVSSGAAQMAGTASGAATCIGATATSTSRWPCPSPRQLARRRLWRLSREMLLRAGEFGNVVVFLYVILLGFIGVSMLIESAGRSSRGRVCPWRAAR